MASRIDRALDRVAETYERAVGGGPTPRGRLAARADDVRRKLAHGQSVIDIARRYGVSRQAIYAIKNGASHRDDE